MIITSVFIPFNLELYVLGEHLEASLQTGLYLSTSLSLIHLLLIQLLKKFKNIRKNKISSPFFWAASLVVPVFSLLILYTIQFLFPHNVMLMILFMVLGLNIAVFYFNNKLSAAHEENLKAALHAQEKEYYFSQCQLMQESSEQVKSIRHDIKLHLSTIKGYAAKINADDITEYIGGLISDIDKSKVYSDTGNITIDSIINFKLSTAEKYGIKTDVKIRVPAEINIDVADIVIILGNLLDNALEAAAKVEDKKIKLYIVFEKDGLSIEVTNTFDGVVKYADTADSEEKVITTIKSEKDHGHGLKNIKKIVEKCDGHMNITHDKDIFSVVILLYVDSKSKGRVSGGES
jgi:sensor histidine kinase YesM